jgi:hypothetical protein
MNALKLPLLHRCLLPAYIVLASPKNKMDLLWGSAEKFLILTAGSKP